jgi:hypothetical protein
MVGTKSKWKDELGRWLKPFPARLGHEARRRTCPLYISGLIGPGDRKSVQPMAARLAPGGYDQLPYIHLYTRLHRRPPAESDIQEYFRVNPPSVHQMVLTLERAGLRQPRTPRSIEVLVDSKLLPELI